MVVTNDGLSKNNNIIIKEKNFNAEVDKIINS